VKREKEITKEITKNKYNSRLLGYEALRYLAILKNKKGESREYWAANDIAKFVFRRAGYR